MAIAGGLCCAAGYEYYQTDNCEFSVALIVRWLVLSLILYGFLRPLSSLDLSRFRVPSRIDGLARLIFQVKRPSGIQILVCALILALLWLPYVIALWPGNLYWDTLRQIQDFRRAIAAGSFHSLSNHHPVFDTLLFGSVVDAATRLGLSYDVGVSVLVLAQVALSAISLSFALWKVRTLWRCPESLCLLGLGFMALLPIYPIAVNSLSKDSLFSWVYVLWLVEYFAFVDTDAASRRSLCDTILLVAMSALACLTKKTGIYIVCPSLALAWLLSPHKKSDLALLCAAIAGYLSMGVVMDGVVRCLGIRDASTVDALSIPLQQSARTYIEHAEEIPAEERQALAEMLLKDPDTLVDIYHAKNADYVKAGSGKASREAKAAYLRLWFAQAWRFPASYLDAWAAMASPLFAGDQFRPFFMSDQRWAVEEEAGKPPFAEVASAQVESLYHWFSTLPAIDVLFMEGFYALYVPAQLLLSLWSSRRPKTFALLSPVLLSVAVLLLSPIIGAHFEPMRYYLPFLYIAPFLALYCLALAGHAGSQPFGPVTLLAWSARVHGAMRVHGARFNRKNAGLRIYTILLLCGFTVLLGGLVGVHAREKGLSETSGMEAILGRVDRNAGRGGKTSGQDLPCRGVRQAGVRDLPRHRLHEGVPRTQELLR